MTMKSFASTVLYLQLAWLCSCLSIMAERPTPAYQQPDEADSNDVNCAGCLAVVDIVDKHMLKKSSDNAEVKITELLEDICQAKNFPAYDYIPPKMVRVCEKLMDTGAMQLRGMSREVILNFYDDLQFVEEIDDEKLITYVTSHYTKTKKPRAALERAVCLKLSGLCVGSNRIDKEHDKVKDKIKKTQAHTDKENSKFDNSVDELLIEHGGKLKRPSPIKHTNDEL